MPTGSYDERRFPSGPKIEPGGGSSLRGPKRTGPIRGVVPGDDVEVAREISRLWEWHYRLEGMLKRFKGRVQDGDFDGGGNFGCFTSKVLDQEDPDLVAYFDMQEESGNLEDRSENSYSATAVGSPEYQDESGGSPYPSEPSLKSIEFSPTAQESSTDTYDHFVLPAAAVAFGGTQAFTVEIVARYLGLPATRQIFASAMETNNTSGWWFGIDSSSRLTAKRGSVTLTTSSALSLQLGDWFHAALRFNGTKLEIILNGSIVANIATSASITASTVAYLGRVKISSTNYYFDDQMAAATFWSRVVPNAELAARFLCITRTASGDPDEIGSDPDGRPPTTIYTLTGNAFSGAEMVLHQVSDDPNGGWVRIPRYRYWETRGWRLIARAAVADLDGGPNLSFGIASDDVDAAAQETEIMVAEGSYSAYDITTSWQKVNRSFTEQEDEATVTFYSYLYKSTTDGADTVSVGAQTVQMYWVTEEEADQIIQENNIPAGGATNDILEWDGVQWVSDKLENANVDPAAAIAATKLAAVPNAQAFHSVQQNVTTGTWTALALDSEAFDTDTIHDTVTNNSRMTCKTAGLYLIVATIVWENIGGGTLRMVGIRKGGATFLAKAGTTTPIADAVCFVVVPAVLAVNDYVELMAFQDTGGTIFVKGNDVEAGVSPRISIVRLSA